MQLQDLQLNKKRDSEDREEKFDKKKLNYKKFSLFYSP